MSIHRSGLGIAVLVALFMPVALTPVAAAGGTLTDILREKGVITKEDWIRVKAADEKEAATRTQNKEKDSQIKVGWGKKGLTLATPDGLFQTKIQWRFQGRWTYPERSDPRDKKAFTDNEESTFELRRVRMKVGGHGYQPWIKYYFEVDWQPGRDFDDGAGNAATRLIDWRIMLEKYKWAKLRIGQWKINYSRERVDSSGKQTMVERSIMNRIFTIDRQIGAMLYGRVNPGTPVDVNYYLGVYSGSGRGVAKNDDDNMMYMGRLQWNVFGRELKWRQSDVTFHKKPTASLSIGGYTTIGKCTRWSSGGCGNISGFEGSGSKYTQDGRFRVDGIQVGSAFKYRGFAWQHETHWKQVKDSGNAEQYADILKAREDKENPGDPADALASKTNMFGGYAMAGYFPHYLMPAIPKPLEVAFRYSHVDTNVHEPGGFRQEYTLGFNWFFAGHRNKLTLDVSHLTLSALDNDPMASGYDPMVEDKTLSEQRVRLQWDVSF